MDQMTVQVWAWLGAALGTLLIAVVVLWASKQLTVQGRDLWSVLRGQKVNVLQAIDEPADPLIQQLARYSGLSGEAWAAFLPAFLRALADGLDVAVGVAQEGSENRAGGAGES